MKITDLLKIEAIDLNAQISNKEEAIDHLVDLMMASGNISHREEYKQGILAREAISTTGIGEGIAIPHAQVAVVNEPGLAVMVVKEGVDYNSLDGQLVRLFFMIAAPEGAGNVHLEALAKLSRMLMNSEFKEQLINAATPKEFLALIDSQEIEKNIVEQYDILAVTACPTGIAHTFMAAESLETMAKKMGISIKVETNGATGSQNILTSEEIAAAKCIIVAADKPVEMSRFDGRPVIMTKVADGINKTEELLKLAINDEVEVYHYHDQKIKTIKQKQSLPRILYTQLSEGISRILPILMGAGALISIASLVVSYNLFNISSLIDNTLIANSYVFGNAIQGIVVMLLAGFIGQTIAQQLGFAAGVSCGVAIQLNVVYFNDASNPGLLGGIIAGFIGGYAVLIVQKLCKDIPKQFDAVKTTTLYPILSIVIAGMLTYLISPSIGIFNNIISSTISEMNLGFKLILGILIGGSMSIDMGGPVNKIAYFFGISQILEGNYDVMAAVMAGGMVSPLAIAFATSFFEYKFSKQERELGQNNFVKGLSFISEGTIPFVQKDGQLVVNACVVASAIAGGLAIIYNCGIRMPHGGIFILPLMIHPLRFVVALLAGSICGGAIYGLWKETEKE